MQREIRRMLLFGLMQGYLRGKCGVGEGIKKATEQEGVLYKRKKSVQLCRTL